MVRNQPLRKRAIDLGVLRDVIVAAEDHVRVELLHEVAEPLKTLALALLFERVADAYVLHAAGDLTRFIAARRASVVPIGTDSMPSLPQPWRRDISCTSQSVSDPAVETPISCL